MVLLREASSRSVPCRCRETDWYYSMDMGGGNETKQSSFALECKCRQMQMRMQMRERMLIKSSRSMNEEGLEAKDLLGSSRGS